MNCKKLCILSCTNFEKEVRAVLEAEGWDDVFFTSFPAHCGLPPITWSELRHLPHNDCQKIVVLGSACLKNLGEAPADFLASRLVHVDQCFHLIAPPTLVDEAISKAYMMTPAWLASWRANLQEMGFIPEHADTFFGDFVHELLLLDTGIDPQSGGHLAELQKHVKMPCRRVAIGLDYTRLLLTGLVQEWRLAEERLAFQEREQRHAAVLADHVAAMDMLVELAKTEDEAGAIATIEDLFHMLFAPTSLHYLRVANDVVIPNETVPAEILAAMQNLQEDYIWTPDGLGFLLRISNADKLLGLVCIDELAFPEYRERYVNMALAVSGVCGLAIENARNRNKLLEAQKMASLSILVAGVAHEINTPLGVVQIAATSLQKQSQQLAQSFTARSMTQTELQDYLTEAKTSTDLIIKNMARIGQLTDAFRQVAVDGNTHDKQTFKIRGCLEEVIRTQEKHLQEKNITVKIFCDPELEIESHSNDWVSIFENLISNSFKHGFKTPQRGTISISVNCDRKKLQVDYQDDGVGLSPEVLAKIFEPFFTTNLQHGMGLGMHLVYNLITHRLGGTIHCQNKPDTGTLFHIEVPI